MLIRLEMNCDWDYVNKAAKSFKCYKVFEV